MINNDITAVILAGGRGKRMGGVDKGLITLDGLPIIEHIIQAIQPQCQEVIINANRNISEYEHYQCPVISDTMNDFQGPLAGFATAIENAKTSIIITLPCDAPKLPPRYVERMLDAMQTNDCDIAVAHDGQRLQPVYALIKTKLKNNLSDYLNSGDRKIDLWYAQNNMTEVDFSDCPSSFDNVNTPEQKNKLQRSELND